MQFPDTLHNAAAWVVIGLLVALGWSAGAWTFGLLSTVGKIVVLVVVIVLAVLLILGTL